MYVIAETMTKAGKLCKTMIYFDNAANHCEKPPEMERAMTAAIQHMGNSAAPTARLWMRPDDF